MGHDGGLYRACSQKCPPRTFGCLLMLGGDLLTRVLGRWDSVGGWYRNPFPISHNASVGLKHLRLHEGLTGLRSRA